MKNGILILLIILSTTVFLKTNEALAQTETKNILIEAAETIVSKEMEQRKKTIADYQQDLKSKEEQIKILEEILKKTDKSLITIATIIDKNIRDTNATFVFNTNNFGKISARAISINGNIPVPGSESDYGIEHRIEFAGLTPGRTYSLEINAILPSGGESKVDISIDSEKSFSTSTDMQAPTVFFTKNDSPASPGQVEIKYSTEQRVQIEISCKKIVPGLEIIECARGNFGKIELTKSGRSVVSANYYSGTGTITVDKLEADSVYAFSGRAVNERGIERKIGSS